VGAAEARRGKPSWLEAIAFALGVSVATANLSVVPAMLSSMLKYGAIVPAVVAGIILALFIAPGILSTWTLGRHRLHGYFLGSYALTLALVVDKASPEGDTTHDNHTPHLHRRNRALNNRIARRC